MDMILCMCNLADTQQIFQPYILTYSAGVIPNVGFGYCDTPGKNDI